MDKRLRALALLAALVFAAALLCSASFMSFSAGHSCRHDRCQICSLAALCQSVVKVLAQIAVLALLGAPAVRSGSLRPLLRLPRQLLPTLISNKVKLSN